MSKRPTVVVCAGSDCAKDERANFKALLAALDGNADVVKVKCLKVCHGPVAIYDDAKGSPVVIEKLRSNKTRDALVTAVTGDASCKGLSKLAVRGSRRTKALDKAGVRA